tara:strand:- start:434 stop:844 length:411 start_codon:yes stop_codon:yes gene_type:complete
MPKKKRPDSSCQDWVEVVWRKPAPRTAAEAKARGLKVETKTRHLGTKNTNNKHSKKMAKVEQEDTTFVIEKVTRNVRVAIQKGRAAKGMKQADLARRCNVKTQIINDYEQGRAKPNPTLMRKMERVLGVKLLGKGV